MAFSPNVRIVATGSYDKTIRLWDSATGREVGRLQGHDARVTAVAFSPDGKQLASGGTGESVINLPRGGVLTTAQDDFVRLWDVSSGKQLRKLPERGSTLSYSPDGTILAIGGGQLIDIKQGPGARLGINGLSLICLVDTATGTTFRQLRYSGTAIAFSADSKILAIGQGTALHSLEFGAIGGSSKEVKDADYRLQLYDMISGQKVLTLPEHVNPVAFCPDGNMLVAANWYKHGRYKGNLQVWDLRATVATAAWIPQVSEPRSWTSYGHNSPPERRLQPTGLLAC